MVSNDLEALVRLQVPNPNRFIVATARKECATTCKGKAVDWTGVSFKLNCEVVLLKECRRMSAGGYSARADGTYVHCGGHCIEKIGWPYLMLL
jgi:hypothetical protein